jgi:outer membrane murein-binding lipoprotein Lpp
VTLSPIVLTLVSLLLAAGGALAGFAVAWGRSTTRLDAIIEGLSTLGGKVDALAGDVAATQKAQAVASEREAQHRSQIDALISRDREHDAQIIELRKEIADSRHTLRAELQAMLTASGGVPRARPRRG